MSTEKRYKTLDDLYISPFTSIRHYDENGQPVYSPLERNLHPTGLYAADLLLQSLTAGESRLKAIAHALAAPTATSAASSAASPASPATTSAPPTACASSTTFCASPPSP